MSDVFHVFWIRKVLTELTGYVVGKIGVGWCPDSFGRIRGYEGSRDPTWQSTSFLISKWSLIEIRKKGHSNCPFHLVVFHQSWWLIIIVLFVILFSEIMGLWANIKFPSKVMWIVDGLMLAMKSSMTIWQPGFKNERKEIVATLCNMHWERVKFLNFIVHTEYREGKNLH